MGSLQAGQLLPERECPLGGDVMWWRGGKSLSRGTSSVEPFMEREWPPGGNMAVLIMLLFLVERSRNVLSHELLVEVSPSNRSLLDLDTLAVAGGPA